VHVGADGARRAGTIVETEAYVGPDDRASHARVGQRGRAAIMYGEPGVAYIYLIYGMHYCFNAVTERDGYPGAVLVRALAGIDRANGPALLCSALNIDRACNGLDLTCSALSIEDGVPVRDGEVSMGPRIGVDYAGPWADKPWRFWVTASRHVSRPKITGQTFNASMLR
jgi:DNA-3-methyladenine glycosylase